MSGSPAPHKNLLEKGEMYMGAWNKRCFDQKKLF